MSDNSKKLGAAWVAAFQEREEFLFDNWVEFLEEAKETTSHPELCDRLKLFELWVVQKLAAMWMVVEGKKGGPESKLDTPGAGIRLYDTDRGKPGA